jgi:hypothetical protein
VEAARRPEGGEPDTPRRGSSPAVCAGRIRRCATPPRWGDQALRDLKKLKGQHLEVIRTRHVVTP